MIEAAFSGRLGKPPQLRSTAAGNPWVALSLAVGSGEESEWVSVAIFGQLVDELPEDLQQGDKVYIEGKLSVRRWAGGTKAGLQVTATHVDAHGRIGRRTRSPRRVSAQSQQPLRNAEQIEAAVLGMIDEEAAGT